MWPEVLIGARVLARITAELERVYPAEGLVVPLVALRRRDEAASPCALLRLPQLAEVVVAEAVLVPAPRQVNALARVSVLPHTDGRVNAEVLALLRRFPRLRACAHLHSHPFARGRTFPSRGAHGDYEGHMLPLRQRNRACNLDTSFSLIACRDVADQGWVVQAFALDDSGEIVDLGRARSIPDDSPALRRCFVPPLARRTPQRELLRRWRRGLRRAGLQVRGDDLFDGWWRGVVRVAPARWAVLLVPLGFPGEPAQVYAVREDPHSGARTSRRLAVDAALDPAAWPPIVAALTARQEDPADDVARTVLRPRCAAAR